MNAEIILAAGVAIVTSIACIAALLPLVTARNRREQYKLEGRVDEIGRFLERMLRIVYGVDTREEHHYHGGRTNDHGAA